MASLDDLNVGQAVSWNIPKPPQDDSIAHGIIKSINKTDETATINVWAIMENGDHEQTDRDVVIEVGRLRIINDFRKAYKVSARVESVLRDKLEEHNSEYGDDKRKRTTLAVLKAVFRRGVGAYRGNPESVRGNVRSADQWAYARVNGFIYALQKLKFRRTPYDTDLLPSSHPLSTRKSDDEAMDEIKGKYDDLDFTIPKGAKEEAQRGLDWVKEHGRGGTNVGRGSARYILRNQIASPEKVRHIARYFPRHEVDKQAEGYRQGEDGYPSNGRIAWALWGGDAGKSWSQKLVKAMNKRDEKDSSILEIVRRRNQLKLIEWEERENRFESAESKDNHWWKFDALLRNWDFTLTLEYYQLIQRQKKDIINFLNTNPPNQIGIIGAVNHIIDTNTKNWKADVYDLYLSMITDFYYFQFTELLPETIRVDEKATKKEIEAIRRGRRRKPLPTIVQDGFFPLRGRRGVQVPLETMFRDSGAIEFVNDRLTSLLPEMSKTRKDIVSRGIRKAFDEANKLGLTGDAFNDYIANELSTRLTKAQLGNAQRIARTEGLALAEYGKERGAEKSGLQLEKSWLTRRDGLVRDQHIAVDNQRRARSRPFNVAGYKMDYPADSKYGAPIELIVNCRCTTIYHEKKIRRKK